MRTNKSLSRTYFIAGLVIGLGIALLYNYLKNDDDSTNLLNINSSITAKKQDSNKRKVFIKKKSKRKNKKLIIENDSINPDSLLLDSNLIPLDSLAIDSLANLDSLRLDSINIDTNSLDSIYDGLLYPENDSLEFRALQINNSSAADIKVSQDELIFAMLAYPKGKKDNFDCSSNNKLDSVLVNNIHKNRKEGLYVEFWLSPLNYKGYRLSKATLILYGFYEYNTINLRYTEDGFIELKYKEKTYNLQCTDDFKALK